MAIRALIAVAAVALVAAPASAQTAATPRGAILKQAALFKQGKWRAMYATYTARFRRACPYTRFLQGQRQTRRVLGTNFKLTGIQVRLEGKTTAVIAYSFVRNGRTIGRVTFRDRDVYTKVGGNWYDELDRVSSC